jgi:hypothetical protein
MELVNGTRFALQATQAIDKTGRPWLVVVAKATYRIPRRPDEPQPPLAPQQRGLLADDLFEGAPGLSSPLVEGDQVPRKPACDVLVKGSAYAPHGEPAKVFEAGLQVGPVRKLLRVLGPRHWVKRGTNLALTNPGPCTEMLLSYGRAFGGMFNHHAIASTDPRDFVAHPGNLVGRGYARGPFLRLLADTEGPNLEALDDPVIAGDMLHTPASLGPVARHWMPRLRYAGTYDQRWQDEVFPLLPPDFDDRYHQCAPADQQMPYPAGGETVTLLNLTPGGGVRRFKLPRLALPMLVLLRTRGQVALEPVVDTLLIDTDTMCFDLVWRASLPLARGLHEVDAVAAGSVSRRGWQARVFGRHDGGLAPPGSEPAMAGPPPGRELPGREAPDRDTPGPVQDERPPAPASAGDAAAAARHAPAGGALREEHPA